MRQVTDMLHRQLKGLCMSCECQAASEHAASASQGTVMRFHAATTVQFTCIGVAAHQ